MFSPKVVTALKGRGLAKPDGAVDREAVADSIIEYLKGKKADGAGVAAIVRDVVGIRDDDVHAYVSGLTSLGGKVQQRIIRSRLGHTITLDDSDDQPSITITDKTGKNTIRLESSSNNLSIAVDGDVSLKAKGTVSIEGQSIHVKATNDLKLKGASADVEAQAGLTLKGGTADLEAQGPTTIKGATVSIN